MMLTIGTYGKFLPAMILGVFAKKTSVKSIEFSRPWQEYIIMTVGRFNPTLAGVSGHLPLPGGKTTPSLTSERMIIERRKQNRTKALNKANLKSNLFILK